MMMPGDEPPVGQVLEEDLVGHEARHGDHSPAGQAVKLLVDAGEVRNAAAVQVERMEESLGVPTATSMRAVDPAAPTTRKSM